MTKSTFLRSFLIASTTWFFISSEKASPLKLLAYNPSAFAYFSKAAVLYQPAVAVRLLFSQDLSKKMPTVAAFAPKAAVILDAKP